MPRGYLKREASSVGRKKARGGSSRRQLFSRTPAWKSCERERYIRERRLNAGGLNLVANSCLQEYNDEQTYLDNFEHDRNDGSRLSIADSSDGSIDTPTHELVDETSNDEVVDQSSSISLGSASPVSDTVEELLDTFDVDARIGRMPDVFDETDSYAIGSFEDESYSLCQNDNKGDSLADQSFSLCDYTTSSRSFGDASSQTSHSTIWEFVTTAMGQTEHLGTCTVDPSSVFPLESISHDDGDAVSTVSGLPDPETKATMTPKVRLFLPTKCAICLEENPNVVRTMNKCNHPSACMECLRTHYIDNKMKDSTNFPLRCFWPSCDRVVRDVQIRRLAKNQQEIATYYEQEGRARFLRRKKQELLLETVKYKRLQQRRVRNFKVLQQCHVCSAAQSVYPARFHHYTCHKCHEQRAIDVWSLDEIQSIVDDFGDYLGNCPSCEKLIIKDGGCDHMICVCGEDFSFETAQSELGR